MNFSTFFRTFVIGISNGMVNYLAVDGIALIMGGIGLVNFGLGAYYVLGAYICYSMTRMFGFGWG